VANLSNPSDILHKRSKQANVGYNLAYVSESQQYPPREYHYLDNAGNGVDVYILDTGVDVSHSDFGNRAFTLDNYVSAEGTTVSQIDTHSLKTSI
jgi:subtilisin family serine protease